MKKVWRSQNILSGYYLCRDKSSVSVGTPIDLDKACPDGITSFLNSSEASAFQEAGFQNFNHSCGYLLQILIIKFSRYTEYETHDKNWSTALTRMVM